MTKTPHIGQMLKAFADEHHWTIEDLEQILGISTSSVYKKLKQSDLDTSFLKRVSSAAGVEIPELFRFGLNQTGVINAVGENSIYYKSNSQSNTERVFRERCNGLEAENKALKAHITTLNRLIESYERNN